MMLIFYRLFWPAFFEYAGNIMICNLNAVRSDQ